MNNDIKGFNDIKVGDIIYTKKDYNPWRVLDKISWGYPEIILENMHYKKTEMFPFSELTSDFLLDIPTDEFKIGQILYFEGEYDNEWVITNKTPIISSDHEYDGYSYQISPWEIPVRPGGLIYEWWSSDKIKEFFSTKPTRFRDSAETVYPNNNKKEDDNMPYGIKEKHVFDVDKFDIGMAYCISDGSKKETVDGLLYQKSEELLTFIIIANTVNSIQTFKCVKISEYLEPDPKKRVTVERLYRKSFFKLVSED